MRHLRPHPRTCPRAGTARGYPSRPLRSDEAVRRSVLRVIRSRVPGRSPQGEGWSPAIVNRLFLAPVDDYGDQPSPCGLRPGDDYGGRGEQARTRFVPFCAE